MAFNRDGGDRGFDRPRRDRRDSDRFERREDRFDRSEKRMYEVTCDACGERCEVPFNPTEGKPVYCSNCFKKTGRSESKKPEQFKKELEEINEKLDKILKSLERN